MSILGEFPHKCTIQRRGTIAGSMGGTKTTQITEQSDVKCWEQNASHNEIQEYERRGVTVTHKIFFTSPPGVTERHTIAITERDGTTVLSPMILEVRSEPRPDASVGAGVVHKVMVERRLDLRL